MSGAPALVLSSAARRALEEQLPIGVAVATWEFCNGPLRREPRRVGTPLGRELRGYYSARRGAYRVIDDGAAIHIVRIDHRSDAYRRR